MTNVRYLLLLFVSILSACGGGSGSPVQPTTATLKLSTAGTLAPGSALAGVGISVNLPAGVVVKTSAGGAVTNGVVAVSGVAVSGGITPPIYTPANGAIPGKVTFVMVAGAPAGFGTGEFATVNCDLAAGANPRVGDFTLTDFAPVDLLGATVNGLTASAALTVQ